MPIYEYVCGNCDNQFEVLQKVSDKDVADCPNCMEPDVRKLVSATSFRLKGSGWYETDFKDKSSEPKQSKTNLVKSSDDKKVSTKEPKKVAATETKK